MSAFLTGLLALSFKGALVAVLVTLVLGVGGRRLPPAFRHGLLLLVVLRLLLPVAPTSPASLAFLTPSEGHLLPGLNPEPAAPRPPGEAPAPVVTRAAEGGAIAPGWGAVGVAVWLLVFGALLTRRLTASVRLRRCLQRARPVTDARARQLLDDARRSLGIHRTVELLEVDRLDGPAVVGWLRPRVVLPSGLVQQLDGEALRHVLCHEVAHVRRLDGPLRSLAGLAAAAHWFNPLVWLTLRRLDAECETACDATVLARLPERLRAGYGRTLIEIAARPRLDPNADWNPGGVPVLGLSRKQHLKRRVLMISRYRPTSPRRILAWALLFAALAVVALTDAPATARPRPASPSATSAVTAPKPDDNARVKETMQQIRDAGTAMFSWVTDAVSPEDKARPTATTPEDYDWSRCPAISHDELAALLVPHYIKELPSTDAWGRPLEFCLDRKPTTSHHLVAGIRSSGRDGSFEGTVYQPGAFPAQDTDRDLVWIDGYFITWPSRDAQ